MTQLCPFCGRGVTLSKHLPCSYQPDRDNDPLGGGSEDLRSRDRSKRVTVRVPESLSEEIDDLVNAGAYRNRSEAIRASLLDTFVATPEREESEQDEHELPIMADGGVDQCAQDTDPLKEFQPSGEYDGYYAFLHGAGAKVHVVDTTTFDNSGSVKNPDGSAYEGYAENIGRADTLCGHELLGRMCPLDTERRTLESRICGTCLRSLNSAPAQGDEIRTDGGVATDRTDEEVKPVQPSACDERRWTVLNSNSLKEVAQDRNRLSKSNLGKHVRGECICRATLPPLTNKGYAAGSQWQFDDEEPPACPDCDRTIHIETVGRGWVCVSCHLTFEPDDLFDSGWPAETPGTGAGEGDE